MTHFARKTAGVLLCLLNGVGLPFDASVFGDESNAPESLAPKEPGVSITPSLLKNALPLNAESENQLHKALLALALRDNPSDLASLQQIFETYPERRHLVAAALAEYALQKRRRPQEWRLLVRSLRLVEGRQAELVLRALRRYRERATKPEHVRQVILLGLRSPEKNGAAAIALLEHWASYRAAEPTDSLPKALRKWQTWFEKKYPDAPSPRFPTSPPDAKYTYAKLRAFLSSAAGAKGDANRGSQVFQKAECQKCHRVGRLGETLGPDLTQISGRLQRKEIVRAVLFPSEIISDQFFTYTVITNSGRSFTGVVGDIGGGKIVVLQNNGEKIEILKTDIDESQRNRLSAMPQGTFERLTLAEIADLFAFLEKRGAESTTTGRAGGLRKAPQRGR